MAVETERKFLVSGTAYKQEAVKSDRITQGYLSSCPGRIVRVRIRGAKGYLTVKGPKSPGGMSCMEWETEIPLPDARALLEICEPGVIDKIRHLVPVGSHTFEVDEFLGANEGLTVAEVELSGEDEAFERPCWLGPEVTSDPRYYNASLSVKPYKEWRQ